MQTDERAEKAIKDVEAIYHYFLLANAPQQAATLTSAIVSLAAADEIRIRLTDIETRLTDIAEAIRERNPA